MAEPTSHSGQLKPPFEPGSAELAVCLRCAEAVQACDPTSQAGTEAMAVARSAHMDEAETCREKQLVRVIVSVLFDLRAQGWDLPEGVLRVEEALPAIERRLSKGRFEPSMEN